MKIAMMVRGFMPAPRPVDIVYIIIDLALALVDGLVQRGHEVYFYGPKGTQLASMTRTRGLRPLINSSKDLHDLLGSKDLLTHYMPNLWDHHLALDMFKRATAGEYDLLHFHHPESALAYASIFPTVPVVYTMHDGLQGWHKEIFNLFPAPNQSCISISNNQRRDNPDLPFLATVYNGIKPELFSYSPTHDDYLLFVGRLVPEKGVREAIQVARATKQKLHIIGPIYPEHQGYFDDHIRPFLNDNIQYLGYIDQGPELTRQFQRAKCFLAPIQWEEPFGMTMVEAMACGTPVIAFRRGSVPEIIKHGTSGFIVETMEGMIEAFDKLQSIKRYNCHRHAVQNFSIDAMVTGYEAAFAKAIATVKSPSARPT